jgi:hypothetical protein
MNKTKKSYLLLFVLALLAYCLIAPVRGFGFKLATGLHCVAFFALTFWALWKYS